MNNNITEYKNFKISSELLPVIKYMQSVEDSRERLNDLSKNWDNLSLLSQLGEAGVNMSEIKDNFTALSSKLINHLADEILTKKVSEMNSKAQVAVDIVIRNLFERTADIGFLATDGKIRELLENHNTKYSQGYESSLEFIKKRFVEYVEKYSVYSDIVLMNKSGDILANIDTENNVSKSHDELIKEVLFSREEYVETYKYHDFLPTHKKSLVYSCKVTLNNNADSETLGVLCLCFKFEDEMQEIFHNLVDEQTKESITLLDKNGLVIASSDIYHIPIGAKFEKVLESDYKIVSFGGRDYLTKSCETNGYQGFLGLGWYGHIMIPLEYAFLDEQKSGFEISQELLLAILHNGNQFAQLLKSIPLEASSIQNNLDLAIWNGSVKQSCSTLNKQFSRALLQEIRNTGASTKDIIGSSIASLTKTMVLGDSVFLAELIVDIMDRNLYERANDCRWWALTTDFRAILESEQLSMQDTKSMCELLKYINDLYTVYTNLFIYDKNGVVVAVSNQNESYRIGKKLSQSWVSSSLNITDSSKYCVSEFERTDLYEERHTYIYSASIRSLQDEEKVLGGIGVVFDSELQFKSMIQESLPKKSAQQIKDGIFAILSTKDKMIISSSENIHKTGEILELPDKFFELKNGESLSEIIQYRGEYYAVGVKCSKGYREFKSQNDDYKNDVYSFVFSYISNVDETVVEVADKFVLEKNISLSVDANALDIATFTIGEQRFGVKSENILEARSVKEMKAIAKIDKNHHFKGTLLYDETIVSVIDIGSFIHQENILPYSDIIIFKKKPNQDYIGILVNSLGDIPSIRVDEIRPLQEYIVGEGTIVESVVFPEDKKNAKDLLSILSVEKIYWELVRPERTNFTPLKKAKG